MSKTTLKQWWADNKTTVIWLVIWAGAAILMIATHKQAFTVWYVLLMLAEGLMAGFCIGAVSIGWVWRQLCYEAEENRVEPIVSETFDMVTVDVPRGATFSALTWRAARMSYAGIHAEHHDWKTWDQLSEEQQWMLMAHIDAGSRITIQLAKHFNNEDKEEA